MDPEEIPLRLLSILPNIQSSQPKATVNDGSIQQDYNPDLLEYRGAGARKPGELCSYVAGYNDS